MKKLYTTIFGSHLYGTNTAKSDHDYKTVYIPELEKLILGGSVRNIQQTTSNEKNRNTVDDVDHEYIPLQVFLDDFVAGQSYALEIAFSCLSHGHTNKEVFDERFTELCQKLADNYLTSNISSLMGYINSQAIKYGIKGKRLEAAEKLFQILELFKDDDRLKNIKANVDAMNSKYVYNSTYVDGSKENSADCVIALEKIYPDTISIAEAKERTTSLVKGYGHRAVKAKDMDGHDWKALSHAVRIGEEIIELLRSGKLVFPMDKIISAEILKVKEGKVPFEEVHQNLTLILEEIDHLKTISTLPTKEELADDFYEFKKQTLINFYGLENYVR